MVYCMARSVIERFLEVEKYMYTKGELNFYQNIAVIPAAQLNANELTSISVVYTIENHLGGRIIV